MPKTKAAWLLKAEKFQIKQFFGKAQIYTKILEAKFNCWRVSTNT